MTRRNGRFAGLFAVTSLWLAVVGCDCVGPPTTTPPTPVGNIRSVVADDGVDLVLANLEQPLRALQVDVEVTGASATTLIAIGDYDLVEGGLDQPKASFTAVVSDTRRLPLHDGAVAHITLNGNGSVSLQNAAAVDADGNKRPLTVVVSE